MDTTLNLKFIVEEKIMKDYLVNQVIGNVIVQNDSTRKQPYRLLWQFLHICTSYALPVASRNM